jgi:hypothetical protein
MCFHDFWASHPMAVVGLGGLGLDMFLAGDDHPCVVLVSSALLSADFSQGLVG